MILYVIYNCIMALFKHFLNYSDILWNDLTDYFLFFFLIYTHKRKIDYIINILNIVLKSFIYILCIIYLNITEIS